MVRTIGSLMLSILLVFTFAWASSNGTSTMPVGPVAMSGGSGYTPPQTDAIDWTWGNPIPTGGRHSSVSGWWNGQVYFANGAIPGFWGTNLCQSYLPPPAGGALGTWFNRAPTPAARGNVGGGKVQSHYYLHSVGGIIDTGGGGGQAVGTYERYRMDLNFWTTQAPCTPRWGHGAAALEDTSVYVFGGTSYGGITTSAQKYNYSTDSWSDIPSLPEPRMSCAGASLNGKIYCIGGVGGSSNTTYEYTPGAPTWIARAPLPTQRAFHEAVGDESADIIKVFGGNIGGASPTADVLIYYPPPLDTWIPETPMPGARDWVGAGGDGAEKFFIMGGSDLGPGVFYDQMWIGQEHGLVINVGPGDTTGGGPVIGPGGGLLPWWGTITNTEPTTQTFDFWTMITLPNGSQWGPPLGPVVLTLAAGGTISRTRTQSVPGYAPPGSYTYTGYVGDYPNVIWDSDSFPFTKAAAGDGGAWVGDWSDFGQPFEDESAIAAMPERFSMSNYPNPFNPTTAISYQLSANSYISLKVYDTAGRLVADLVNSWREAGSHTVSFDATGLPSGVYIYRLTAGASTATAKMVLMK